MDIAIEQVRVSESSEMVGKSIQEMQLGRNFGVTVMAIRRANGQMLFTPSADSPVAAGDYLIVMGRPENLRTLENLVADSKRTHQR